MLRRLVWLIALAISAPVALVIAAVLGTVYIHSRNLSHPCSQSEALPAQVTERKMH